MDEDVKPKKKKGKWSKEAKETYSARMKEKYGVNHDPLPSLVRAREFEEAQIERNSEDMSNNEEKYVSKRAFDYDEGVRFEHGQIVEMRGLPNDAKLKEQGFVVPWTGSKAYEQQCIKCDKSFGTTSGYSMHVAQHYNICAICPGETRIAPELWDKHMDAHQTLS